ncbi:hypothetical protein [Streptomyces sp. NPDC048603]|uniref:hypothetical protein n=1 Tax=Streptomyces sp. NPDC048603 TaxID=3365577 RepID=UPI0037135FD8
MTLEEHALAIEAAIQAAASDGFFLDDTDASTPALDLNDWTRKPTHWISDRRP